MIQNIDYAPTFLEAAEVEIPAEIQGKSIAPVLKGTSTNWRKSLYYSYYEKGEHNVPQHFGVRTETHKLFYLPGTDEWQLFDLVKDPQELKSVHDTPSYSKMSEKAYQRISPPP